ncbi:MAG TPA: MarR family transcriptional regulator [Chloroflexota bacterium]|nr:MarR family transcriptional regulator [Chloroflexota bacterium]
MTTAKPAGEPRAPVDEREELLHRAVKRSTVLGQVMRRAIQHVRGELAEGFPTAGEPGKVGLDSRPEVGQAQFFVLHVLSHAGPLPVGEIAERCHVAVPTVSRMLNHLEEHGLIERHIDTANRRVVRVVLTAAGRAAEAEMTRRFEAALESVLSPLSDGELADLITAFGHLERLVAETD